MSKLSISLLKLMLIITLRELILTQSNHKPSSTLAMNIDTISNSNNNNNDTSLDQIRSQNFIIDNGSNRNMSNIETNHYLPSSQLALVNIGQEYPSNHQTYNADQYSAADYTLPSTLMIAQTTQAPANHYEAAMSREYQRASDSIQSHPDSPSIVSSQQESNPARSFSNSFGNQAPAFAPDNNNNHHNHHTFSSNANSQSGSLNSSLIQNLTAGLFPFNQLSNFTLQMLGDLLSRSRSLKANRTLLDQNFHPHNNNDNIPRAPTRLTNPNYMATGYYDNQAFNQLLLDWARSRQLQADQQMIQQPHHNQYSLASFNDLNQRELLMNQFKAVKDNGYNHFQTSSNVYNTYLPYAGRDKSPLMNGFIDSGYRIAPSIDNSRTSYISGQAIRAIPPNALNINDNINMSPHYIQHHNAINHDHLDKITYHSTPFRPSITNPDQIPNTVRGIPIKSEPPGKESPTNNPIDTMASSNRQAMSDSYQSSSNDIRTIKNSQNNDHASEFSNDKQSFSSTRLDTTKSNMDQQDVSSKSPSNGKVEVVTSEPLGNTSTDQPKKQHQGDTNVDLHLSDLNTNKTPRNQMSNLTGESSSSIKPTSLLDIYEREIDNQIRDALNRHSDPFLNSLIQSPSSETNWFDRAPLSALDDTSTAPSSLIPWGQPITDWGSLNNIRSQTGTLQSESNIHNSRYRPSLATSPTDSLLAALSDLPTFSASDLQPIYPSSTNVYNTLSWLKPEHDSLDAQLSLLALNPAIHSTNNIKSTSLDNQPTSSQTNTEMVPGNTRLPAMLLKLNSKPLASWLSTPLTLLTSNLPMKYLKTTKKPSSSHLSSVGYTKPMKSNSYQSFKYISPESFVTPHYLSGLNYDQSMASYDHASLIRPLSTSKQASLGFTKSGLSLSEHQLQQQKALIDALMTAQKLVGHQPAKLGSVSMVQDQINHLTAGTEPELTVLDDLGLSALSNAGYPNNNLNAASIWTAMTPPSSWTKRQSLKFQGNGQQAVAASHLAPTSITSAYNYPSLSSQRSQDANQMLTKAHGLKKLTSNQQQLALLGLLLKAQAATVASSSSNNIVSASKRAYPRLRIKVLKIPIAYYDYAGLSGSALNPKSLISGLGIPGTSIGKDSSKISPTHKVSNIDRSLLMNTSYESPNLDSISISQPLTTINSSSTSQQENTVVQGAKTRNRRLKRLYNSDNIPRIVIQL